MTIDGRPVIVVGVDGSEASKDALRWAAGQARLTSAELHAVIAWRLPVAYGPMPDYSDADFEAEARKKLEQVIDEVLGAQPPVSVTTGVAKGHPGPVLVEAAGRADLLVIGRTGHGAVGGMLLGSTTQHCMRHARTPVVVIPHMTG